MREPEQLDVPERLERRAQRCSAIDEAGERCRIYSLHDRCFKHRRQRYREQLDELERV